MKIIVLKNLHAKNLNALKNYKNIEIIFIENINEIINYNLNEINCIYLPDTPINIKALHKYNIKFIFGPHFSVFPEENKIKHIISDNSIYVQPSDWTCNVWKTFLCCNNLNIKVLPFGVNTERFKDDNLEKKEKIFVYYKTRDPIELKYIDNFLKEKNIEYSLFSYSDKYNEEDYLSYLKKAKYGIWLGCHESQGFALEEALSCNVPLLVWDIISMKQEYKSNYNDFLATSIPYWDHRCGECFYNKEDLDKTFNLFISKLNNYRPREYILENLTYEICEKKLIDLIKS